MSLEYLYPVLKTMFPLILLRQFAGLELAKIVKDIAIRQSAAKDMSMVEYIKGAVHNMIKGSVG